MVGAGWMGWGWVATDYQHSLTCGVEEGGGGNGVGRRATAESKTGGGEGDSTHGLQLTASGVRAGPHFQECPVGRGFARTRQKRSSSRQPARGDLKRFPKSPDSNARSGCKECPPANLPIFVRDFRVVCLEFATVFIRFGTRGRIKKKSLYW